MTGRSSFELFSACTETQSQGNNAHTRTKLEGTTRNMAFNILPDPIQRNSPSTKAGLEWYDSSIRMQRNAKRNGIRWLICVLYPVHNSLSFYKDPLTLVMKREQIDSPKPQPKWAFTLWYSQTACETFQLMLRCPLGILRGVQETFFFLSFFFFLFLYHDVLFYSGRTKSHYG